MSKIKGIYRPSDSSTSEFVTRDSGTRKKFASGMVRDTGSGKSRFDLLVPAHQSINETMLFRWADLLRRGADKYSARNWELASSVDELNRYRESAFRHFMQWFCADNDGEDHAAAIFFNVNGAEYVKGCLAKIASRRSLNTRKR